MKPLQMFVLFSFNGFLSGCFSSGPMDSIAGSRYLNIYMVSPLQVFELQGSSNC